jgi:sodium/potassium-transporting ATPase subunit alpha
MMKGAPERIIERCSSILIHGSNAPLTDEWRIKFNAAYNELGGLGERVLGFCDTCIWAPDNTVFSVSSGNVPLNGLRFTGLVSLIDPPRPNVPLAVAKCRSAGIRVVMVTGDHPTTAKAIARSIGILSDNSETPEEMALRLGVPINQINMQ